jgi:hypothetical protein
MTRVVALDVTETELSKPEVEAGNNEFSAQRHWGIVVGMIVGGLVGWVYVFQPSVTSVRAETFSGGWAGRRTVGPSRAKTVQEGRVIATQQPNQKTGATANEYDRKKSELSSASVSEARMVPGGALERTDASEIEERTLSPELLENPVKQLLCAQDSQLVEGDYCTAVMHRCVEPFEDGSGRCQRFAPTSRCYPPTIRMRFCIDRYEYPNRVGEKPMIMVDYAEAMAACAKESKRLCTAREWTLACEGPERTPYPQGYVRDAQACNIDQAHRFPDADALANDATRDAELQRIDQRSPSGARPACVSAYGVYDMTGNVDEWVTPDGPEEPAGSNSRTALKGGYYGIVRARCRPSTTSHGPTFKFYQVGFRCCSAVGGRATTRGDAPRSPSGEDSIISE